MAAGPLDELYGLPLSEFTAARNAAARELKQEGDADAAAVVAAAQKPNLPAAALNRLVREERRRVEQFLAAAAGLRESQLAAGDDVAARTSRFRESLADLVALAAGMLERGASDGVRTAIRRSLEAAAVDDASAERLLEGRLVHELEPAGFGSLAVHAPASPSQKTAKKQEPSRVDRAALTRARQRVERAQHEVARAEGSERDASDALDTARARHANARSELDAAEDALAQLEAGET